MKGLVQMLYVEDVVGDDMEVLDPHPDGALIAGFVLNPYIGGGNIMSGDLSLSAIAVSLLGSVLLLLVLNLVRRGRA